MGQRYEKFDLAQSARLVLGYMTSMVDEAHDNLPYWLVLPHKKPAEAAHCRVDDAELVGSWYEGIDAARKILQTQDGADVQASFRRHALKSWGEHGLRFHEDYPWSNTNHSSFHEMGYILPALNCMIENDPNDEEAERRASELVRGLRSLVIQRKVRTFWAGDFTHEEPIYEFPNDVYLREGGFDLTRHTGRGEQPIRNAIMLRALVKRYELTGDEVALDLARGLANFLLGPSRYFNYKMEFFGHVHSAGWVATGLVALGRVTGEDEYIQKGRAIYAYIRSISSSFGWVPEYAQWHPMEEEHCETCCIKDMIECAFELTRVGYNEYWNDINLFARNQLMENQVKYTGYVVTDNSLPDGGGITYRDIDKRMVGGFTGGSLPNSISLSKFRSIAGCCVGTAPVALKIVWDNAIVCEKSEDGDVVVINMPIDKQTDHVRVETHYPDEGKITITALKDCTVMIRWHPFMGPLDDIMTEESYVVHDFMSAGETVEFTHPIETAEKKERARGMDLTVVWRGCDVIDILPHGEPLRLYQRDLSVPKEYPSAEDVAYTGAANYGPTQQKK